jgi:hypothetical protein
MAGNKTRRNRGRINREIGMLGDIAGFARRLEEGQSELTTRLDRIIELLEALTAQEPASVAHVRPLRTADASTGTG